MSSLIERLEQLNQSDRRVRAVLRRSLSFEPGTFVPAFPYVEPFVTHASAWEREASYLVAGLWGAHWRSGLGGSPRSLPVSCALHRDASGSGSVERRFINMLDADIDQLSHRLRQMLAVLHDYSIDFSQLLNDLRHWNDPRKRTQSIWARQFYQFNTIQETKSPKEN